jgi:hypothetical protein
MSYSKAVKYDSEEVRPIIIKVTLPEAEAMIEQRERELEAILKKEVKAGED